MGGRLDHTLSNLNTLYMFPTLRVTLWGDGNLVRLLPPGRNVIVPDVRFEGPACGLIPLGPPVTGNSTGLRWNLCDTRMAIGALISTSNVLEGEEVSGCHGCNVVGYLVASCLWMHDRPQPCPSGACNAVHTCLPVVH